MALIATEEGFPVYSERYESAKKEFWNCIRMGVIGVGVPFVLAFRVWKPIMEEEKAKALAKGNAAEGEQT